MKVMHTYRENNKEADWLANLGCIERKKINFDRWGRVSQTVEMFL